MELRPLQIGPLRVETPVVLAALAGYSDLAYRLICRRLGAPYCLTEVMLDRSLLAGPKVLRRLCPTSPDDHPTGGQVMGREPQEMARAARLLCELGFDVIDLNFACPVRKALSRRRGGYLMRDPERVIAIVRAVVAAADRPVTLKLRCGFARGDGEAFWRIAEAAFDAGAAALCVHARTVEAKYTGPADWAILAAVKRRFPEGTIIGSGDVARPADALRMLAETGVDGVAAARGALGNPWFFRQVADLAAGRDPYRPGLDEQRRLLAEHFAHACRLYGPLKGPRMMRGFGVKYARCHPRARRVREAFIAVKTAEHWHAVLDEFYADADAQTVAACAADPAEQRKESP